MSFAMNNVSARELMELHSELTHFVDDHVSSMPNNSNAAIFQYEKCDSRGTHFQCPVKGCNNTDFFECNKKLERRYGRGARLKSEPAMDGSGNYVTLIVPLHSWGKGARNSKGGAGASPPTFQTLLTLLLGEVVLVGALYWKVFL